jgi:GNAT superfamily N-acetyltransferase
LIDRPDTGFEGRRLEDSRVEEDQQSEFVDVYEDSEGNYFSHSHDLVTSRDVDGQPVGILVGDTDGRNCMNHPHSHLPHPIGLYVRDDYRSRGIASELIHEYMDFVDSDSCVIDCNSSLVAFYEQFDYEFIYLNSYKRGMDPTEIPLPPESDQLDVDLSNSPEHDVAFIEADSRQGHTQDLSAADVPSMIIKQDRNVGQQCNIEIQMHYGKDKNGRSDYYRFTDCAIEKLNEIVDECVTDSYVRGGIGKGDFHHIKELDPDTARQVADELYPAVSDESNFELRRG